MNPLSLNLGFPLSMTPNPNVPEYFKFVSLFTFVTNTKFKGNSSVLSFNFNISVLLFPFWNEVFSKKIVSFSLLYWLYDDDLFLLYFSFDFISGKFESKIYEW